MMPKFNQLKSISQVGKRAAWIRHRIFRLWALYPMLWLLAVALVAIAMQELMPDVWIILLFVALVLCSLASVICRRKQPYSYVLPTGSVLVGIALFLSFLHSLAQQETSRRLQGWQRDIQNIGLDSEGEASAWKPMVCRARIDSALRYRKANLPGGNRGQAGVGWQTLTLLRVEEIRSSGDWITSSMLVPISIDGKVTGYFPGDAIEIYGQWRLPANPSNPGQFNQAKRYAELGYAAQARADSESQIARLSGTQHWRVDRALAIVSAQALRSIERYVVLGQSELTAALVLGQREQADWRLQEELLATGTIHMLSISGMHIEMVAMSLLLAGAFVSVPKRLLLLSVCFIVLGYALLCGANPPVARATMMLVGLSVAKWLGWRFSSLNMLAFSGLVLILYRTNIVFETGTQLSFLAVAVLIASTKTSVRISDPLARLIESKSNRLTKNLTSMRRWAGEMIRTSFWVWFLTAPLVWSSFHVISPIAIALNLLLWIPMLIALIAGLGLIAFGWFPPLGWLLGILCGVALWTVDQSVAWGESIPLGHFWLRSPPEWWLYSFYLLGIAVAVLGGVKQTASRSRLLWILGVWFGVGLMLQPILDFGRIWVLRTPPKLCFTFIDVGHGTNVVVQTPDNETWLYDAGRMGDHQRSYQVMIEALWAMKIASLDTVVLSHADSDHYNGLEGIAKRMAVRRLVSTQQVFQHESPLLKQNIETAKVNGATACIWCRGDQHQGSGWSTLVVHPPRQGVVGSDNAASLSLLFEFAGRRVLLPGDLEPPGSQMLVAQDRTDIDLLMAPHHGSVNAKADALLEWCQPETVVISGSARAMSPRVLAMFEVPGRRVLVTARDDAIRYEIDQQGNVSILRWSIDRWVELEQY